MGAVIYSRLNEPPPNCNRWTPGRKGWVVAHMTPDAAAARFGLDPAEITDWARRYRDHGYPGLCETKLQYVVRPRLPASQGRAGR